MKVSLKRLSSKPAITLSSSSSLFLSFTKKERSLMVDGNSDTGIYLTSF